MGGFLQRGLLLYLIVAICITFTAPEVIFDSGSPRDNTVLSWFDMTYNESSGEVITNNQWGSGSSSEINNSMTQTNPASSGSGSILGFLDPLFQVFSWIGLIFKVIFSPITIMIDPLVSMPSGVVLIIGVPLVLLMIFGLISWIRSGMA